MEGTSSANTSIDSNETMESLEKSVYSIKLGDLNYEDSIKLADELKEAGNKFVKENKFSDAIQKFTDALNLNIETPKNSIYLSNRAMCHIKLENYGLALQDSNKSIETDKDYIKAYYRRASANLVLFHFEDAIKDLDYLYKLFPGDAGVLDKLKKAKVESKKKKFYDSIITDRVSEE